MMGARVPTSTYRLQFHAGFTFADASAILDYLEDLGVGDIYASPYFQAGEESTHGYDVANHNTFNPAVGDESEYRRFVAALRSRNFGQLLDFVPNHMGISESLNVWWMDVLENGVESAYAHFFDIDWNPGKDVLSQKVVLPILGQRYGQVLESGELELRCENGVFFIRYFETKLPVDPRTYPTVLAQALKHLPGDESISKLIRTFDGGDTSISDAKKNFAEVMASDEQVRAAVDAAVLEFHGEPGQPATFDALHALLEKQAYRLSYWRSAADEINYRRFFDVNTLAALRVEIPEVFEASHQLVLELLARGDVTGLRIDHVDGLWNPREYLVRLQERYAAVTGGGEPMYLVVEKILDAAREKMPEDWPVSGTTGYEFANQVVHLLVDSRAAKKMDQTYRRFTGESDSFADLVYEKKRLVMENSFQSEIQALGRQLDELSESHRNFRDFTRYLLTIAVREMIACFPVYRTYASLDHPPSEADERAVLRATSLARRKNPTIEKPVFDFLRNVLLLRFPENFPDDQREAHIRFVMKFQQCTSPVTAKGLEDTVFYLYNRLIALNEVGGNPGDFGLGLADFHRLNQERRTSMPATLLASSTHDTKRSEDVRLRIAVLSEIPDRWNKAVQAWSRSQKKLRTEVDGEWAPSRNEEYFIYQTLVGAWPFDLNDATREAFVSRIQNYLLKALKEGKVNSSWTEPNEPWEEAVKQFIARLIDPVTGARFQKDFLPLANDVARAGAWNSLAATVLKCTVPGVPDVYQGTEIWDFSLVDPDNRRPVDYELRRSLLKSISSAQPAELCADWKSGRIKLFVLHKLLRFRRENAEFFHNATYEPVECEGPRSQHVISFLRSWNGLSLLVVVPRLTLSLGTDPVGGVWEETRLVSPGLAGRWTDLFTGASAERMDLERILTAFPFAVLLRKDE